MNVLDGYLHKITPQRQSWDESRSICQQWGGDLVVHGVQDMKSRRETISSTASYWIGLTHKASEGTYMWVNGGRESSTSDWWENGQPNNLNGSQDCVEITINDEANDEGCVELQIAVCEKRITA